MHQTPENLPNIFEVTCNVWTQTAKIHTLTSSKTFSSKPPWKFPKQTRVRWYGDHGCKWMNENIWGWKVFNTKAAKMSAHSSVIIAWASVASSSIVLQTSDCGFHISVLLTSCPASSYVPSSPPPTTPQFPLKDVGSERFCSFLSYFWSEFSVRTRRLLNLCKHSWDFISFIHFSVFFVFVFVSHITYFYQSVHVYNPSLNISNHFRSFFLLLFLWINYCCLCCLCSWPPPQNLTEL